MKRNVQSGARRGEPLGFLARLRRDARGGAAVMLAVMVIPLLLFVGSAVDIARVYTVKARLQQACDAGALAGRRSMDPNATGTALDTNAAAQANAFFNNNFHQGWFQTAAVSFTPSRTTESQVAGVASATVPMALMKMFGFSSKTLNVTCEARNDIADADIMFVLDQTGSMACLTSDDNDTTCKSYVGANVVANGNGYSITEKSGSRISGLRTEVLNFFDTVTGQADASTNFRFGFVPYNATANVGKLLQPLGYVKTSADYQTRFVADASSSNTPPTTKTGKLSDCAVGETRSPAAGLFNSDSNGYYATVTKITYTNGSNANNGTCTTTVYRVIPQWSYYATTWPTPKAPYDTSSFILGNAVDNPAQFVPSTSTWTGCVEERLDASSNGQTSFSMTSPPKDLDPDAAPATAADGWTPWWPDVTFARSATPETTTDLTRTFYSRPYQGSLNGSTPDQIGKIYNEVACPLAAKRLSLTTLPGNSDPATRATNKANVRASIQTYLSAANGFRPYGTTYHDVGMKWGLRLLSPTGMFAGDTAAWTGHNPPNRFIIFLTDGDIETDPAGDGEVYSEYGMEKFDKRVGNGATGNSLDAYHNARFLAECQLAKNRNIKIFVIAYAQALTTELSTCASPGQAYPASDQAGLAVAFGKIAKQVAMLRISK